MEREWNWQGSRREYYAIIIRQRWSLCYKRGSPLTCNNNKVLVPESSVVMMGDDGWSWDDGDGMLKSYSIQFTFMSCRNKGPFMSAFRRPSLLLMIFGLLVGGSVSTFIHSYLGHCCHLKDFTQEGAEYSCWEKEIVCEDGNANIKEFHETEEIPTVNNLE